MGPSGIYRLLFISRNGHITEFTKFENIDEVDVLLIYRK
jgi:hypothetical protein